MAWYFTASISLAAILVLLFFVYLFLVAPGKKRPEMERFKTVRYAHRGLHGDGRAENSLTAFRAAVEAGYGIELDVRLSGDGELVVFHDDTLIRMCGVEGKTESKTLAELKALTLAGTDEHIPSFR